MMLAADKKFNRLDDEHLQKSFRLLEWSGVGITAVSQYLWACEAVTMDRFIALSLILLAVAGALSFLSPRSQLMRFLQVTCQVVLISMASGLGDHHLFYLNLYILGAKAAILLNGWWLVAAITTLTTIHISAGQYFLHALRHLHTHHAQPEFYRNVVVESQAILYFLISLTTVFLLGRLLGQEKKNFAIERRLAAELESLAVKSERARIAREIHDGLGHSLTSLKIQLELALKSTDAQDWQMTRNLLTKSHEAAKSSLVEVRRALKASTDGELDLETAVRDLVARIDGNLTINLEIDLHTERLGLTLQHQIYSIVKECLTNIRKHAQASRVDIALTQSDDQLRLTVKDNGIGFKTKAVKTGFGLRGLNERASALGGAVEVQSTPGSGTVISLEIPIASQAASGTIHLF
jgi:signal transduction histidine kinase